ncbi:MAG: leucine-rich repeat protein [Clostridia bacterium]|nr:leucine-rich repeat protein [Clostridia bacterium]
MKRLLIVLLVLLLCALPALAEDTFKSAAYDATDADTTDEQLAGMYEVASKYSAVLESGGWDVDLDIEAVDSILDTLIPDVTDAQTADSLPEELKNAKFIPIYDQFQTTGYIDRRTVPWAFYLRLPEANRAKSIEDADAVLYVTETFDRRGDYIGTAYNRVYQVFAARLDGGPVYRLIHTLTTPPQSGMGALAGQRLSQEDLWRRICNLFYNTQLELLYPEQNGKATFRLTGSGCCLVGLDGTFPRYEVPTEVEGIPVTGIEKLRNSTVEELILPEGITYISGYQAIDCVNLTSIQFPSTLKRITGEDVFTSMELTTLTFNEGLEEIGKKSIDDEKNLREINLPSTLRILGSGFLSYGISGTWVALPEGLTRIPDQFLTSTRNVECVFLPASIEDIRGNVLNSDNSTRVYAPEGSAAAAWAAEKGKTYIPCESAEDMPHPIIETEGDFTYIVVEGETMLVSYTGADEEVTVPDELGGCPVTVIKQGSFKKLDNLKNLYFPKTIRQLELWAVTSCKNLEGIYVPCSPEKVHFSFMSNSSCGDCRVYAPADSTIAAIPEVYKLPWTEWEP